MTEQLLLESVPLNALDRCDRCGAQAYVRAVLLNGGELMFCAHHGKEYAEKLKPIAAKIQDESEKLIFYRESPYANHRRRAFLVSGHNHKTLDFQLFQ
jgi:hypothetical protein